MLRGFDDAIDWSPDDPRLDTLADVAAALAGQITLPSDLPDFSDVPREVVELLVGHLGIDSPSWRRLDHLVTQRLTATPPRAPAPPGTGQHA